MCIRLVAFYKVMLVHDFKTRWRAQEIRLSPGLILNGFIHPGVKLEHPFQHETIRSFFRVRREPGMPGQPASALLHII
ncbi:hypothetical protein D3C77_719130 [compost metagenome]